MKTCSGAAVTLACGILLSLPHVCLGQTAQRTASRVEPLYSPDTVVRWHRRGFALCWRWTSRPRGTGRPAVAADLATWAPVTRPGRCREFTHASPSAHRRRSSPAPEGVG